MHNVSWASRPGGAYLSPSLMSSNLKAYLGHENVAADSVSEDFCLEMPCYNIRAQFTLFCEITFNSKRRLIFPLKGLVFNSAEYVATILSKEETSLIADDSNMWQIVQDYKIPGALVE